MELLIKILVGIGFIVFIGVFICWLIPSVADLKERDKKKEQLREQSKDQNNN